MLLFIMTTLEQETAKNDKYFESAESLIHLWYSASLPSHILSQLKSHVQPLITDICTQIHTQAVGTLVERSWHFSYGRAVRLALRKEDWFRLEKLCDVPSDLTWQKAFDTRTATTLAPERRDFRERWYFKDITPPTRISKQKFRHDGLLLPFGHNRRDFDKPNPYVPSVFFN